MYVKYGGYSHQNNECSIQIQREAWRDTDDVLRGYIERWTINGRMKAAGADLVADLTTDIGALKTAYATDGSDIGLYEDDGTPTAHVLTSSGCVGGVRVITQPSFPVGDQAEYATYRTYTITLEGRVETAALGWLAYQDSISTVGTGEGEFVVRTPLVGDPVRQDTSTRTPVKIRQSGSATGRTSWPSPANPVLPAYEHKAARNVTYQSPKYINGSYREYTVQWSYEFECTAMPSLSQRQPGGRPGP